MSTMLLKNRGFTLIEALIAIVLAFFIVIGVANVVGFFPSSTADRLEMSCLVEGAVSGVEACRAGQVINSIQCGGFTVNIDVNGSCAPSAGSCNEVTVTATLNGRSFSLKDTVCNFI